MDTRTIVELDVREMSDRLVRIGHQHMGEFTYPEAAFFHAASDLLYAWCNAMDELRSHKKDATP
jgi:hypothetical protein